jgi:hypothetical protein
MGMVALPLRRLLLLLLPTAPFSIRIDFQATVFSRDWARVRAPHYYANSPATGSPGSVSADAQGSPWCNAGCIPNGSLTTQSALLPTFRAPSLVQLMDGAILAISDERNVSRPVSRNALHWSMSAVPALGAHCPAGECAVLAGPSYAVAG